MSPILSAYKIHYISHQNQGSYMLILLIHLFVIYIQYIYSLFYRPPPKWKINILIWLSVFLVVWLTSFSGIGVMMLENDFPLYMVIFLELSQSVTSLTYLFFPILMSYKLIVKWLSADRPKIQDMNFIMSTLDQGLELFEEEAKNVIPQEYALKIEKMERRLETLKRINYESTNKLTSLQTSYEHMKELYDNMEKGNSKNNIPNVDISLYDVNIENGLLNDNKDKALTPGSLIPLSSLSSSISSPRSHLASSSTSALQLETKPLHVKNHDLAQQLEENSKDSALVFSDPVGESTKEMKQMIHSQPMQDKDLNKAVVTSSVESNQHNGNRNPSTGRGVYRRLSYKEFAIDVASKASETMGNIKRRLSFRGEESLEAIEASKKNKVVLPSKLTMSVLNRVKWECTEAFEEWQNDMTQEMAKYVFFVVLCIIINKHKQAHHIILYFRVLFIFYLFIHLFLFDCRHRGFCGMTCVQLPVS